MPGKKLNQFKGRLSPQQVADGINAAQTNARRLADDAKMLLDAGRLPSAASLAILAIEESGKVSILRRLSVARDDKEVSDCWRDFRSHTKKNVMWIIADLLSRGARRLDDFSPMFASESDHPQLLDHIKQISFYTDCLGSAHWSQPAAVIDESLAKILVSLSHIFATGKTITPKEIELWVHHLGPVWMGDPNWIKKALENWYSEMQSAGLAPAGTNEMEDWIRRGVISPKATHEA
jgi:AbiV family abortive infection protein